MLDDRRPLCLILAPFGGAWERVYQHVAEALYEIGISHAWVGAMADRGGSIQESIQEKLLEANLVIADISDFNPNVMYELGCAHALKKAVLLVTRHGQEIPFDLMGHLVFVYDPSAPDDLTRYVRLWAQRHTLVESGRERA